jgi:hypothetical protein
LFLQALVDDQHRFKHRRADDAIYRPIHGFAGDVLAPSECRVQKPLCFFPLNVCLLKVKSKYKKMLSLV